MREKREIKPRPNLVTRTPEREVVQATPPSAPVPATKPATAVEKTSSTPNPDAKSKAAAKHRKQLCGSQSPEPERSESSQTPRRVLTVEDKQLVSEPARVTSVPTADGSDAQSRQMFDATWYATVQEDYLPSGLKIGGALHQRILAAQEAGKYPELTKQIEATFTELQQELGRWDRRAGRPKIEKRDWFETHAGNYAIPQGLDRVVLTWASSELLGDPVSQLVGSASEMFRRQRQAYEFILGDLLTDRLKASLDPVQAGENEEKRRSVAELLPYSPLHHLLLGDRPLVMTSANVGGEPIVTSNENAAVLRSADAYLYHDREIITPCDDSVVRVFAGSLYPVRRSRGYAPLPVQLREGGPTLLAVGGELKSAFCVAVGDRAFLSQHLGDMGSPASLEAFEKVVAHLIQLLGAELDAVACDAHPNLASTRWAEAFAGRRELPLVRVQHHRSHVAALAAEHGHASPLIGVCFDGTGYGDDGAVWGGEIFAGEAAALKRVAHVDYVPLPGGDAAVERPYRCALAHLWSAGVSWDESLPCVRACPPRERAVLLRQLERNVNCAATSSVGRLFDAVVALVGVRQKVTYEAQAAIELEAVAEEVADGYDIQLNVSEMLRFDPRSLMRQVARDVIASVPVPVIAGRFHRGLADAVNRVCRVVRERTGVSVVGLTGGVFQNVLLLRLTVEALRRDGFDVLIHRQVPANDGGLSLGQAVLARLALTADARVG